MTPAQIPWAPGAKYTHIICRLGDIRPDGEDTDELPDLLTQSGTVKLFCAVNRVRYTEADGRRRMLTMGPFDYSIRASDGELFNPVTGTIGVSIPSSLSAGMDPAEFTWSASVTMANGDSFNSVIPPMEGTFDLVDGTDDVPTSMGVSTLSGRVTAVEDRVTVLEGSSSGGTGGPVSWTEVTGKPSSYPPSPHSHTATDLSGVVKTVNGTAPDGAGDVTVSGGGDGLTQTQAEEIARDAVGAALAAADIATLPGVDSTEIAFSVVDEGGRRTWIESGYDGAPTAHATAKIAEAVGPGIGLETQDEAITGLAFAVVDEDGRRTEIEVGEDGRFTPRVLQSIANRLPAVSVADPSVIVLPSVIPAVVGQESRIYWGSVVTAPDPSQTALTNLEGNVGTHWKRTPGSAATVSLGVTLVDRTGATVTAKSVPVQSYVAPSGAGRRHLAIGDSITRAGNYAGTAVAAFAGASTVGTRTYNDGVLSTEGRGGWSLDAYTTRIGNATTGDSPFLFPAGVAGAKFWGNTAFWRKVCYDDPNGYEYQGFQRIARNWTTAGPFLFDAAGYPVAPAEGDVVIDPTYAAADMWRQYTSGSWVRVTPPAVEFSFSKYLARYAAAYPAGGPTSISIMLGTNDFRNGVSGWSAWKTRMDQVIASIRAWSPTVPIIIICPPTGGPWPNWGDQTVNKWTFDERMKAAGALIIAAYDTPANVTNRVHVASALGAVAPENISDHVHPSVPTGHDQLAKPLAGMLAKLITEGIA